LDFGKHADYSALCVVQAVLASSCVGYPATAMHVRHLERYPLGTGYDALADRIAEIMATLEKTGPATLLADATGVGGAAVDLLRERGVQFVGINIHGGGNVTRTADGYSVPKLALVGTLETALQTGALKIAEGLKLGGVLATELQGFRRKQSRRGHVRYEHARAGDHDDLLLATSLACWGVSVRLVG